MNICSNCNFWKPEAVVAIGKENMGGCNKLSPSVEMSAAYVLPVLDGVNLENKGSAEILTSATFGCNQFVTA
jgi:hypothetical protein